MLINRAHCIPGIPTQGWWSEGRHSLNTPRQPYTCCGLPMSQAGGTTTACTLPAAASPSWHITAHQAWATAEGKGKCLCAAWGPSCATAQHAQLSYHDQNDLFFSLPHSKQIMRCTGSLFEEKGPKCHILINKQQFLTSFFENRCFTNFAAVSIYKAVNFGFTSKTTACNKTILLPSVKPEDARGFFYLLSLLFLSLPSKSQFSSEHTLSLLEIIAQLTSSFSSRNMREGRKT